MIAAKINCPGETGRDWVHQAEHGPSLRAGPTTDERESRDTLEDKNRETPQANEVPHQAAAYCAVAEPGGRPRPGSR